MSEWFRSAFGAEYLSLYEHRDEAEAKLAVELLIRVALLQKNSRVLDAPCGSGRHARAFALAEMRAIGIDLSRDLLDVAATSNLPGAPSPCYLRADLRDLPLKNDSFELVANLFSSFGYLDTDAQNAAVLHELARVCRSKGFVVIDFMNAARVRMELKPESIRQSTKGCTVQERRWISSNPLRVNKETIAVSSAGERKQFHESVRLFTPDELELMMNTAGVPVQSVLGNYSGGKWTIKSPRLILIGKKR
ncbi:MAG: class I SAM-dependent methyltransferase [Candidatus Sumerlaeaceae bacterium]